MRNVYLIIKILTTKPDFPLKLAAAGSEDEASDVILKSWLQEALSKSKKRGPDRYNPLSDSWISIHKEAAAKKKVVKKKSSQEPSKKVTLKKHKETPPSSLAPAPIPLRRLTQHNTSLSTAVHSLMQAPHCPHGLTQPLVGVVEVLARHLLKLSEHV